MRRVELARVRRLSAEGGLEEKTFYLAVLDLVEAEALEAAGGLKEAATGAKTVYRIKEIAYEAIDEVGA